jgi:hypothetical protein
VSFFGVTPATGSEVGEPSADYSIEAGDFYFQVADPSSGEATVESLTPANKATRSASVEAESRVTTPG